MNERPTGISEQSLLPPGAREPQAPPPAGPRPGRVDPLAGAVILGGALVIVGSMLSWNHWTVGPLSFVGKSGVRSGVATGTLLLGVLMAVRAAALIRGSNWGGFGRRSLAMLIGPGLTLVLLTQYAVGLKTASIKWLLGTESTSIAQQTGLSRSAVLVKLHEWLDAGQSHITLAPGFWITVAGAIVVIVAVLALVFRKPAPRVAPLPAGAPDAAWPQPPPVAAWPQPGAPDAAWPQPAPVAPPPVPPPPSGGPASE